VVAQFGASLDDAFEGVVAQRVAREPVRASSSNIWVIADVAIGPAGDLASSMSTRARIIRIHRRTHRSRVGAASS
jgi:hypothetical protein